MFGSGLVYLLFVRSLVPFQFFREAIWGAWRTKVAGDLGSRAGFRGGRYLDFRGSLKLLSSPHLRGRRQRAFAWDPFWVCLEWISSKLRQRRNRSLSFLWGVLIMMDMCFGSALILLIFIFVKVSSFVIFCFVIGVLGLGVFFGMVGYPALACTRGACPWAASADDIACARLERLLGSYTEGSVGNGSLLVILLIVLPLLMFLVILMFGLMVALFLMSYRVLGLVVVVFTLLGLVLGGLVVGGVIWSYCLLAILVLSVVSCLTLFAVLFSLFSVLSFGVLFLPYSAPLLFILVLTILMLSVMFLGFWRVAFPCRPFELTFDEDLLTIIVRMIHLRGVQKTKVSKVKGHADDDMVAVGRVRVEDRIGNDLADRAADFGRRRVSDLVIDVRWRFLSACSSWYPVVYGVSFVELLILYERWGW